MSSSPINSEKSSESGQRYRSIWDKMWAEDKLSALTYSMFILLISQVLFNSSFMISLMLIISIILAVYCFVNSKRRRMKAPCLWALFGLVPVVNYFAVAILHGNRWLKDGETRCGGRFWDSCRWLAITSTIFLLAQLIHIFRLMKPAPQRRLFRSAISWVVLLQNALKTP